MEDQDREARMDEEVEAHHHKAAPAKHKAREDDRDDVEAHHHKAAPAKHKARGDDGDDVEGHVFIGKHKAKHKA
jgi:hypothetical protein